MAVIPLGLAGFYVLLAIMTLGRRAGRGRVEGWLIGYQLFSVLLMGLHGLNFSGSVAFLAFLPGPMALAYGLILSVALVGFLTTAYTERPLTVVWAVLVMLWLGAVIVAEVTAADPTLGSEAWAGLLTIGDGPTGLQLLVLGWLLLAIVLMSLVAVAFLTEPLPLYANRILFWAGVLPLLLVGDVLAAWLVSPWLYVGYGMRAAGLTLATYSVTAHRIPNVRGVLRGVMGHSILTLLTAALVFAGVYLALRVPLPTLDPVAEWGVMAGIALTVALLLQPLRQGMSWLLRGLLARSVVDPAEVVRRYSQMVGGEIELDKLVSVATRTLNDLLNTRYSCLILVTRQDDKAVLEAVGAEGAERLGEAGELDIGSPIHKRFVSSGRALLQYDIDFDRSYQGASETERRFFSRQGYDVYVPILDGGELVGLLALGPKRNDDPFHDSELNLLTALANQMVTALRNARLVADLRRLNAEISSLNEDLGLTNERLRRMDEIKSDFITISSHELRTPLTQIQGYAHLLLAMSEGDAISSTELREITAKLTQAGNRMTEVIGAMTDVSRIDVESLDLNFVEVSLSSVLKLAIEPYAEAIQERKMRLVVRGLRDLPLIHGDYPRLVQAFENLVTNAIKFTPDGGQITISGEVYERDETGRPVGLRVTIADTGIGIAPEDQELIFGKFYRVGSVELHSTGTTKFKGAGPGLGLSIAKGVIERHGGRIWVESPGHDEQKLPGSAFHVVLPLRPPAIDAQARLERVRGSFGG